MGRKHQNPRRPLPAALRLIAISVAFSLVVTACVTTASGARDDATSIPTPPLTLTQSLPAATGQPASTAPRIPATPTLTSTMKPSPEPTLLIRPTSTPPGPTPTPDPTRTAIAAATEAAYLCSPELVEQVLTGFIEAFNAGDWEAVGAFMPEASMEFLIATVILGRDLDKFRGSYMSGPTGEQAVFKSAEELHSWLIKRHTFNEDWFLQGIHVGDLYRYPQYRSQALADFVIQFVRQADDLATATYLAKG